MAQAYILGAIPGLFMRATSTMLGSVAIATGNLVTNLAGATGTMLIDLGGSTAQAVGATAIAAVEITADLLGVASVSAQGIVRDHFKKSLQNGSTYTIEIVNGTDIVIFVTLPNLKTVKMTASNKSGKYVMQSFENSDRNIAVPNANYTLYDPFNLQERNPHMDALFKQIIKINFIE